MSHLSASPSDVSLVETSSIQFQVEPVESTPGEANRPQPERQPQLQVFFSTFFTIFLAELGDKTQLTTLLMSAESHAPWTVFAGAGAALVLTSLLGVWLGCWLAKRVAPRTLEIAAGSLLLIIAAQLIWEVVHL